MNATEIAIKCIEKEQARYVRLALQCQARIDEHCHAYTTLFELRRQANTIFEQKKAKEISPQDVLTALDELSKQKKQAIKASKLNYMKEMDKQVEYEFIANELQRIIATMEWRLSLNGDL